MTEPGYAVENRELKQLKINSFFFLREGEKKLLYKVLFWLACASKLTSFRKTATPGLVGFGEFTLL